MAQSSSGTSPLAKFEEFNAQLQAAALKATRHAALLPADLNFYRSMDRGLASEVDACSSRVLSLANRLLGLVSTADSGSARTKAKGKGVLEHDDVTDNFRSAVVDSMDRLLERADICLDDFLGLSKAPAIAVNVKPAKALPNQGTSGASTGRLDPALQHASHLPKPQLKFRRRVNNDNLTQWRPTLRHKYNAQVPLGYELSTSIQDDGMDVSEDGAPPHPYRYEIKHVAYPARMFAYAEPLPPNSFEATPFAWVDTPALLDAMLEQLRGAKEIAVDLEYHSYRSFAGFVCLMQISTRDGDWVVDALALREELEDLNEVFTDPDIVKVFHGAESDIVWLQQDFNLYIVNLFDTFHASKVLDFPRHSLATLMEMYCDFTPDKRYQLADWRIRPLPMEMLRYARSDTHFLLFIYDNLRNALLDRAKSRAQSRSGTPQPYQQAAAGTSLDDEAQLLIREVLRRSEETALRVYEHEIYDAEGGTGPGGWDTLARKWNKAALVSAERDSARKRVFKAVHAWRDRVARADDESTRYVLPNHQLFLLAEQPPTDMSGLLGMFPHVPAIIRRRAKELLDVICAAEKKSDAVHVSATDAPVPSEVVDVTMAATTTESAEVAADPTLLTDKGHLWPTGARPEVSSSLFGASLGSLASSKKGGLYATSRSALFPSQVLAASLTSDAQRLKVREVVARIHGTLVIAPSAPTLPASSMLGTAAVMQEEAGSGGAVAEQVEIPFVPASERQDKTIAMETVKDTIVVVGQPQRKRPKREKKALTTTATTPMGTDVNPEAASDTPFDYSTVSNILDEGSDQEAERAGSGRKRKQRPLDRAQQTGFRAPPKAPSEVRRGNLSRTFR